MDKRRKNNSPQPHLRPGPDAIIVEIQSKPDLNPENYPNNKHEEDWITNYPRRKFKRFRSFQIRYLIALLKHVMLTRQQ